MVISHFFSTTPLTEEMLAMSWCCHEVKRRHDLMMSVRGAFWCLHRVNTCNNNKLRFSEQTLIRRLVVGSFQMKQLIRPLRRAITDCRCLFFFKMRAEGMTKKSSRSVLIWDERLSTEPRKHPGVESNTLGPIWLTDVAVLPFFPPISAGKTPVTGRESDLF